ncbi:MAG: hypothetical protein K8S98_01925 [Planctomycetes bacterium]|nr:hypothetical protein [Planctomycetota bacterium]
MDRLKSLFVAAAAAAATATLLSSCIAFVFVHDRAGEPLAEERTAELEPGVTSLAHALEVCGAPTDVWELPGGACAVAYGWLDDRKDGVNFQVPLDSDFTPNLELEQGRARLHGVVLFFDASGVLVDVRRGFLKALRGESVRPAAIDDDSAS